jgi:predicted nucleotidyltransferase
MRLTKEEQFLISKAFLESFESGKIYLFGSRVDDNKKGGDIDLYLCPAKNFDDESERKLKFLLKLYEDLGEQKIDIVLRKDRNRLIEQEAIRSGVLLDMQMIKVQKYLHECDKHIERIEGAYSLVKDILPLSALSYENLDDDKVRSIDQYLFRFAKLQDTIGEKLFKIVVSEYVEDSSRLTFLDILNRLEKVGILEDANSWKALRNVRNSISHQYDDNSDEMADAINKIFAQKDILVSIYKKIKQHFKDEILLKEDI